MASRGTLIFAAVLGLAGPAACVKYEPTGLSIPIPSNARVYTMVDSILSYHYVDSTHGSSAELWWEPQRGFEGFNCIGLVPSSPTDTVGTFVFAFQGRNVGILRERVFLDTTFVTGFFLPSPNLGTHGSYVLDSAGHLKLTWADGTATQYFDPTADIQLHNDTITSRAELSARADSVHASWSVSWARSTCQ
jgi:hypothetical protein